MEDFQRILQLESRLHREGRDLGTRNREEALELLDELSLDVRRHSEEEPDQMIHVLGRCLRIDQARRLLQIIQNNADHGVHRLRRHQLPVEELAHDHSLAALLLFELGPLNDCLFPSRLGGCRDDDDVRGVLERIKHLNLRLDVLLHLRLGL